MLLKSPHLRNFFSFGKDSLPVELGPLNVIIGANGPGKSNFIDAIDLMRAVPCASESSNAGVVVVDLAAERGGNCELTVADERIVSPNGVTVLGHTDCPSRMAAQASTLYATNLRRMLADLTPGKDGRTAHNMEDDVTRSVTATREGEITFPPPPPKIPAIAAAQGAMDFAIMRSYIETARKNGLVVMEVLTGTPERFLASIGIGLPIWWEFV